MIVAAAVVAVVVEEGPVVSVGVEGWTYCRIAVGYYFDFCFEYTEKTFYDPLSQANGKFSGKL